MSYRGAKPERIAMLLEHALSATELRGFIRSKTNPLLLAGEKPRHQPATHSKAALWLARFGERGQAVLAKWIQEKVTCDSSPPMGQLVPRFRAMEREGVEFEPEEMRDLCRYGLVELYGESPPKEWLEYLATEPDTPPNVVVSVDEEPSDPLVAVRAPSAEAIGRFVQWARGEKGISDIPDEGLRLSAKLCVAARERDPKVIAELPGPADQYNDLDALLRQRASLPDTPTGLLAIAPALQEYDPAKEYTALEVIATLPRRAVGQAYFLTVEAFIERDAVHTLAFQELAKAFPDNAEIILFPDLDVEPAIGRPAAYRVERALTPGKVKSRVVSQGRPLLRVFYVPASSDSPDRVRDWLTEFARTAQEPTAVFVLTDGVCIKPRSGALSRLLQPDYDWIFDGWPSVSAVEFHKAPYIVASLSSPAFQYDCAPLAISARRLLRRLSERKAVNLTRQQWGAIIEQVRADGDGVDEALRQRVIGKLETLSRVEPDYESLITDLMATPSVKVEIETRKQLEVTSTSEELRKERNALDNARREKLALQESIDALREQHDERVKKLRAAMRRVFEEAKGKEAETLAQVGLLQVLKAEEPISSERRRESASSVTSAPSITVQRVEAHTIPLADAFRAAGFPDAIAPLYAQTVEFGLNAGLPLVVEGPGAAVVSLSISRCLGKGATTHCEIPLGLASPEPIKTVLDGHVDGPLVLRNANLSDISVYAGALIDELIAYQLRGEQSTAPRPLILAGAGGAAALPWPIDLQYAALKLNLAETPYTLDRMDDFSDFNPISPIQRRVWSRLKISAENSPQAGKLELLLAALLRGRPTTDAVT
jgi:hypothetical protein